MAKAEREAAEGSDRSLASPTRCLQGKGVAIHRVARKDSPKKVRRFLGAKVGLDENGRAGIDWASMRAYPGILENCWLPSDMKVHCSLLSQYT